MSDEREGPLDARSGAAVPAFTVDADAAVTSLSPAGRVLFDGIDRPVVGESVTALGDGTVLDGRHLDAVVSPRNSQRQPDSLRLSVSRGGTRTVPYDLAVDEAGPGDSTQVAVSEVGLPDRDALLSALRRASALFTAAETAPETMQRLERCLADAVRPTGVDVRLHEPASGELWRLSHADRTAVVDSREVVAEHEDPYATVDDDPVCLAGESLQALADKSSEGHPTEAYTAVLVVPVGDHGVVAVGRLGARFSEADVDAIELLCERAATAMREQTHEATIADQRTELDRYETLVESIPDPVYLTDEAGKITVVNRAFERTFDYDPDDEAHITEFTTTESATTLREAIRRLVDAASADETTDLLVTGVLPDGRKREFQATVGCVADDGEFDSAVGIFRDVTDSHREEEIATVLNRAFRHNLRTATNNIKGYAEVTQSNASGDVAAYMDIIQEECDWLMKLGDTMREIRQSISGDKAGVDIPVTELVDPVVQWNESEFPEATVTAHYNTEGHVEGGTTLRTALDNIVENAIVHNDSATPAVEIWVANAPEDHWLDIHVRDNGPGIPDQERQLLMGETEITQLQHGSGLGLWVARWLVQAFDGELLIEADEDGTVVTLRVRQVQ